MTPEQVIYQAIGEASMCWEDRPTGIFDSDRAKEIGDRLWNQYKALESRIQKLEAVAEAAKDLRNMWHVGSIENHEDIEQRFEEALAKLEQK